MSDNIRMHNPEDSLVKRMFGNFPEVAHKYYGFPGEYIGPCQNEYPDFNGKIYRTDTSYFVNDKGEIKVMNVEDESSNVNENTLKKVDKYSILIRYTHGYPVISGITTTVPLKKCKKVLNSSQTSTLKPIIRSLVDNDEKEKYIKYERKINDKEIFEDTEALDFVLLPRMCEKNNEVMLEKVCSLLPKLKVKDIFYKNELKLCMKTLIHKYAKTDKDIIRLEEVINMKSTIKTIERKKEKIFRKGEAKGILLGELKMAISIMNKVGIDKAIELTEFTKEELTTGKLQK